MRCALHSPFWDAHKEQIGQVPVRRGRNPTTKIDYVGNPQTNITNGNT